MEIEEEDYGSDEMTEQEGRDMDSDYVHLQSEGGKMASLKEAAQAYEPPQTLNIADLDHVNVDIEIKKETHTKSDGEDFTINVIEVEGKKYRVPSSVLNGMKAIIERLPSTKLITVLKSGTGMNTSYQVLPWSEQPPLTTAEAIKPQ